MVAAPDRFGEGSCDGRHCIGVRHARVIGPVERGALGADQPVKRSCFDILMEIVMMTRNRLGGATLLGAVLALGLSLAALADTKAQPGTQQPTASPAAGTQLKANKPGRQPDIYCTHDANNHNFQACGED